jgi:hypothetical protein
MFFFFGLLMFKGQCSKLSVQRPTLNAEKVSGIVNNGSQENTPRNCVATGS